VAFDLGVDVVAQARRVLRDMLSPCKRRLLTRGEKRRFQIIVRPDLEDLVFGDA